MSNLMFPLEPRVFTRKKGGIYKQLLLDFTGTITYNPSQINNCQLKIMNSLVFDQVTGEVKVMIGGVTFFEGEVFRSYWSTENYTTNSINLELNPTFLSTDLDLAKSTFNKGDPLSSIIPTSNNYTLKNEYSFPAVNPKAEGAEKSAILEARAQAITDGEQLGTFSQDRHGKFYFKTLTTPKVLKTGMQILQQKINIGDMVSLDIVPNLNLLPQTTFTLKTNNRMFQASTALPYTVVSTSINFTSRRGAIQSVQAVSDKYKELQGRVVIS